METGQHPIEGNVLRHQERREDKEMRGFTVHGVKFRPEDGGYLATLGDRDAWVFIRPRTGGYSYSASVLVGETHYCTDKTIRTVAAKVLRACAIKAERAFRAFAPDKIV